MLDKNRVLEILSELKIKPTSRPQELSIEDWARLVDKIS
jgi:16S rRNA A1518/A1519 N6-dimethyltransferase RsmA/KsgA/DIM1 with predicted DNA glycosylase/AP lyase activity